MEQAQDPLDSPSWGRQLWLALATALAYAATGSMSLWLTGPGGYAAALYPAAGIALAAVLVCGRAAGFGVWLGALAVNAGLGWAQAGPGWPPIVSSLFIASGAAAQAMVGAALVLRLIGRPVVLNAPRDILLGSLGGAFVACGISCTVATTVLVVGGALAPTLWLSNWLTWWVGDLLGVLIAAPLALTFIGQPAADWRPRRRTIALPLLVALGLLTWATYQFQLINEARSRVAFERDVDRLASDAQARLRMPLYTLQALHGAALASGRAPDEALLREAARWWLAQPMLLQAVGHGERVASGALADFEAQVRTNELPGFMVFQRDGGQALAADGEAVVLRRIHPMAGNDSALGLNALSVPAARAAVLATRDSAEPRATEVFRLTQSTRDESGLVLYQALYDPPQPPAAQRSQAFRGVLFVAVNTGPLLADLATLVPAGRTWCVVENTPSGTGRTLAGSPDCALTRGAARTLSTRALEIGGRALELRVSVPDAAAALDLAGAWLFSLAGVSAAALLGALLLVVTGLTRRTELDVQAATSELRREVHERSQAEQALRVSEARLRSILDNVPLGVAFLDAHGSLLEGNQHLFDMLGSPPQALIGRRVADVTHADDQGNLLRQHLELLAGRLDVVRGQVRLRRADGGELWVRLAASAQRDDHGRVLSMVAVIDDISEHRRLEAAEQAVHRAEAANRAKTEFVSRMSHELRTPLNAMIGFAQLAGMDEDPAPAPHQREWMQQIQRAGWHLLELINETLDLARIESGAIQVTLQPVALAPLLANCRAMLSAAAAHRQVTIDIDSPALAVLADPVRLRQVLTNLLSNAVKYNRDGGRVSMRAEAAGEGRVALAVSDSGIGLSPAQLERLFVPYDRLGREHSGIEGTGIGLVISRRLAELMGGTLEVESEPGTGSTFTLTLNAAALPDSVAEPEADGPAPPPRHQRVLYIEDNPTNVEVMRGILGQRAQIRFDVAMLGLDGLVAARRDHPDLILLDMQLPDISGLELLRMLKNDDDLAGIPVIVVSADATPARVRDALTLGALEYITKPVDVRSLLKSVDDVLEGQPSRWNHSV